MQTMTASRTHEISNSHSLTNRVLVVIGATLLVAACAHVSIPLFFTPVPLTLQTFAVLLVGLVLGPRAGFAALALYLAEGAAGLPVFNPQGLGGVAQMVGPTAGYLLSYPFAAALAGVVYKHLRITRSTFVAALAAGVPATLVIFAMGAGWLALLTHANAHVLWATAVAPFLPGEVIKISAAAAAATSVQRWRKN
ncbi:MAG: biotin transporter BioY [Acidobacteriaceae bacterium]